MKKSLFVLVLSCLLAACYRTPLEPHSKNIIITRETPPSCCQYVADMSAHEGILYHAYLAPVRELEIGAMNQLRNKAFELDANYVHLLTPRRNYVDRLSHPWVFWPINNAVTYYAKAYICPPPRYVEE